MSVRIILIAFFSQFLFSCTHRLIPEITSKEMESHINCLASDQMEGRYPGTPGDSLTLVYIENSFRNSGLKSFDGSYLQKFNFLSGISPSEKNKLEFNGQSFVQGEDFYPASFSSETLLEAPVAYCGYGFDIQTNEIQRNDYYSSDPEGKWALILRGEPEDHNDLTERSGDRDKAMLAMEKGAKGVLLVSGTHFSNSDRLDKSLEREPEIDIPVIRITRNFANMILKETGKSIGELENSSVKDPDFELHTEKELSAELEINKVHTTTANVIGYLKGNNSDNNKWIVIGAHHDHLGMGGKGSSSRTPDTVAIHNGADDNASGIAALLELAGYFSSKRKKPSSGMIFVTFGAEEKGLLGSRHFVEHPPVKPVDISLMINIDMLGRMKEDSSLQVGGVGSFREGKELITQMNDKYELNLSLSEAGYGPSDHASFYARNIPVYFFSTGPHEDYHTAFDDPDSLNYEGIELATRFIADVIEKTDQRDSALEFTEAGPKSSSSRSFRDMVTLGIMPDVSGSGKNGMEVLAVTNGKPADLGGMRKGDIITAIEGEKVENVYDYMYRLKKLKEGERIVVTIRRNNEIIDLLIQL